MINAIKTNAYVVLLYILDYGIMCQDSRRYDKNRGQV
jgi:hypothetical protein